MRYLLFIVCLITASSAQATKIAVTDLSYSERVVEYLHFVDYHNEASVSARSSDRERETPNTYSASSHDSVKASSKTDYTELESTNSYIEYGELRKFVGDIKGEILKNSNYQLTQAKPYTNKDSEKIFDIINRIKKGYYPNADYVLFGTVSELEFRNEANPVIGSESLANTFSLSLVAEFSLINTKTYEVTAAFSATGEGQDVRLATVGSRVVPSRAKVVSEVSKSLGIDVVKQLQEQLDNGRFIEKLPAPSTNFESPQPGLKEGEVMQFSN